MRRRVSVPKRKPFRISLQWALFIFSCLALLSAISAFLLALSIHWHPNAADSQVQRTTTHFQDTAVGTSDGSFLPLTAYLEPPLQAATPLPPRVKIPLKKVQYPQVKTCLDIPNLFPVHHAKADDDKFGPNVGKLKSLYEIREEYAKVCPVDADPFLPWIHDLFLSSNYQFVEFVAHNKRRCRTDPSFGMPDLKNLEPQVALMQSVPIKRLDPEDELLRGLEPKDRQHRYRLASLEDADPDTLETRFICHFHHVSNSGERSFLGETFSAFPYNYEDVNYRKGPRLKPMLTRPENAEDFNGAHNDQVWNSVFHFRCPVPENVQSMLRDGATRQTPNGVLPGLYMDLVPIRTPPRETKEGYSPYRKDPAFDPSTQWGQNHLLPRVQDSGRWTNIPIGCRSPVDRREKKSVTLTDKKDYLVGCLWASAAFTTRGPNAALDTSTAMRLLEWLAFHLYIAKLDHVYIYDNTEAHTDTVSLQPIIDLFPPNRITRIPWKHRVCNNNFKGGERSSQYSAEASCRIRYGPSTEWMIFFDTDEYLIPQGNWTDLQDWLRTSTKTGAISKETKILSFFQTRPFPRVDFMEPYYNHGGGCGETVDSAKCLTKRESATFLETYDCETTPLPKPNFGWRAQKQIYQPEYVLNHFVHYTMVTQRANVHPDERIPAFLQRAPYERRVNELTEAFMLHAKTKPPAQTQGWKRICAAALQSSGKQTCPVGIPWPLNVTTTNQEPVLNEDGYSFNCYQHSKIQNHLVPRLREILKPLQAQYKEK